MRANPWVSRNDGGPSSLTLNRALLSPCDALHCMCQTQIAFIDLKPSTVLRAPIVYAWLRACLSVAQYIFNVFAENIVHERKMTTAT